MYISVAILAQGIKVNALKLLGFILHILSRPSADTSNGKIPSFPESAKHRNRRQARSDARGVLAAVKLGLPVPTEAVEEAIVILSGHHATEETAMQRCLEYHRIQ